MDQPIICDESNDVRYVGDTLALVVGETPEQVQAALAQIQVDLEPLPVISTIEQALAPDAPVLHERLRVQNPDMPNVLIHFHTSKGDIEQGFREADLILEDDYQVPFVEHAYMEPEVSISAPEGDGVVVYVGSQGPTDDRRQLAVALGLPEEKVRMAHMYIGGGFGGKEDVSTQIHSALAAYLTGRPVKVKWSREESLKVSYKRHAARLHYKVGAKKDGRIVAADVHIYGDTGAYASAGEAVLFRMSAFACGPYEVPHVNVHAYAVHTNNPPCGAFRGYGSPQVAFSAEIHLQKIIDQLKLDPFEVRLNNALDIGKATITGDVLVEEVGAGVIECLQEVRAALAQEPPPPLEPGEKLGIGISAAYKNVGLGSNIPDNAGARVSLEKDGTFLVRHGAADMGQGSNQVVATIASRVLGVPLGMIRVHTGDTRYDPEGGMTTASRATFVSGNAALKASEGLRARLWEAVASEFNVPAEDLEIRQGVFTNRNSGQAYIRLQELAKGGEEFAFETRYDAPPTQPPAAHSPAYPLPGATPLHFAYDFAGQVVMLAVHEETGRIRVIKLITAQDVGVPLIRRNVIGQMEGAAVQGLGYALSEQFEVENALPKSLRLKDMGLLRFRDIPEIQPIIVEDPHPKGPFGAKGMGELAITPTAPAVANAVHDAVGIWINSLPITPEKILAALREKKLSEKED
jgi:CO/xanthine dehydrogenase Mo-binding subunit